MKRTYCDRCKKEESKDLPIYDYQILAKMETQPEQDNTEYAIEFESLEVCQPCAKVISEACKTFVKAQTETPGAGKGAA